MGKKIGILLVLVMLMSVVAMPLQAQDPVTFIFGSFSNPIQLYGAVVTDGVSFRVLNQGCEGLMTFDGATTGVIPLLAKELTSNEDLTVWTATLQEGVTFHDGTPFNAEAVKANFEAWRFTDNPLHFESQVYEYYDYMFDGPDDASLIQSMDTPDDYTIVFNLSRPYVQMPATLAMSMFQIHSPAALEAAGEDYGTPPVGYSCTGPYAFTEWVSDDHVTQDLYADYWGEVEGNVERVLYRIIPDNAARFAAIQAGEIHAKENATPEEIAIIEAADDLYVDLRPSLNVLYLAFSYRIEEFRNPLVRQAISQALNLQAYVDTFYVPGAAEVASTFLPPLMWGYNPEVEAPTWDPDAAAALMAEAGYPDGLSEVNLLALDADGNVVEGEVEATIPLTLYWQPATRPYNPDGEGIGQAMSADLAGIGINVELNNGGDWATFLDMRRNGELTGLYQLGWTGDNGDPDNFSGYFFKNCGIAREGYFDFPEICDLLTEAGNGVSQDVREPLYQQADAMLAAEAARISVAHTGVPLIFSSAVSGYVANPLGNEFFKLITME
ncbi:ABC transporter substrate-binding protein [Chloroflexota bacterium]